MFIAVFGALEYVHESVGLYEASDLLLGDHVCEKSDTVKWIGILIKEIAG